MSTFISSHEDNEKGDVFFDRPLGFQIKELVVKLGEYQIGRDEIDKTKEVVENIEYNTSLDTFRVIGYPDGSLFRLIVADDFSLKVDRFILEKFQMRFKADAASELFYTYEKNRRENPELNLLSIHSFPKRNQICFVPAILTYSNERDLWVEFRRVKHSNFSYVSARTILRDPKLLEEAKKLPKPAPMFSGAEMNHFTNFTLICSKIIDGTLDQFLDEQDIKIYD